MTTADIKQELAEILKAHKMGRLTLADAQLRVAILTQMVRVLELEQRCNGSSRVSSSGERRE